MGWFEDLIAEVQRIIGDATAPLYGFINDNIANVYNALWSAQTWATNQINAGLQNVNNTVWSNANYIVSGLNTVQSNIWQTINNTSSSVIQSLNDALDDVQTAQYNATTWLNSQINSGLANVQQTVGSIANTVSSAIDRGLANVQQTVGGIATQVGDAIGGALTTLQTDLAALGGTITRTFGDALRDVGTAIATAQEFVATQLANLSPDLGKIAEAIAAPLDWSALAGALGALVSPALVQITSGLNERSAKKQEVLDRLARGEYKSLSEILNALADPPPADSPIEAFCDLVFKLAAGALFILAVQPVYQREPLQRVNMRNLTEIPSLPELAAAVVQGIYSESGAADVAAMRGMNQQYFNALVRLTGDPPGLMTMLEMWNRGFVTEPVVDLAIKQSRLKTEYLDAVKKLRWILPPLQDVIRMGVREAWRDDVAVRYGYDEDMPDALTQTAPKLGIDPDWMKRYWRAHWELPSITMVLEMLHRTRETGITDDDVDTFLRVQDVPRYWREKIRAVSYAPYTRVDTRRMYKTRVLTRDDVYNAYRALGYDHERATHLTEFTIKLDDESGQLNPDVIERKHYTALENLFVAGKRDESALSTAMQTFGWGQQAIDAQLEIARLRREARKKVEDSDASGLSTTTLQRRIVERLIDLHVRGQRGIGDVEAAMNEFGWGADVIELMTRAANLESALAVSPSRKENLRELTISAILNAFEAHMFTEAETLQRLQGLGLSADDAATEIAIQQYQTATKLRNKIVDALKDVFLANELSESDVGIELARYGFLPDEVAGYTALWTVEKSLRRKRFTEPQLAAFMKHDVITTEQYAVELAKLGYDDEQTAWWLQLRGAT